MSREKGNAAAAAPREKLALDPKFVLRLTATLLGICAVVAVLLAVVDNVTRPTIRAIQEEKTAAAMRQVLDALTYEKTETQAENVTALYAAMGSGAQLGWVAEVTTNGFGGPINMVVGVDMTGAVTGVAVIKSAETPNVGTKVVGDQTVLDRFVGLGGEITVNGGDNRFDAVSGATVSSKAVTAGVNAALAAVAAQ